MKLLKIQQDILKALLANPENVKHYHTSDDGVFVMTPPNSMGYVIPRGALRLDLTGVQIMGDLDLDKLLYPENLLHGTDDYRLKGKARRFVRRPVTEAERDTYIFTDLLKNFENPRLYQGPSPLGMIVVTEDPFDDGQETIVGVVMPCKVKDTEDDETEDWEE